MQNYFIRALLFRFIVNLVDALLNAIKRVEWLCVYSLLRDMSHVKYNFTNIRSKGGFIAFVEFYAEPNIIASGLLHPNKGIYTHHY